MKFCILLVVLMIVGQVELNKHRHHHHTGQEGLLNTIGPKQGIYRNKLVAEYGTNFRYIGKVKNGLDRVTVVISIPIPRYEKLQVEPIDFGQCAKLLKDVTLNNTSRDKRQVSLLSETLLNDQNAVVATKQWCAKALPYIEYLKQQEKYLYRKGT